MGQLGISAVNGLVLAGLFFGRACFAQERPAGPTDPKISPNAKRLYEYLQGLPQRQAKRIISGQVFDKTWESFDRHVVRLHQKTGQWVGMLHSWRGGPWVTGKQHLSVDFIYPLYYNYYHRGGILMLLVNPCNPWTGRGIHEDKSIPPNHAMKELLSSGTVAYDVYRQYLSNLADNLAYFQKDDIPVIVRLFGENNGKWFWFHHGHENVSAQEFHGLWKYTVGYLREERGLHNLLFCYEVTESRGERLAGLVPDHTDILGIQCKRDPLTRTLSLYKEYLPYGKPIVMPQFLPYGTGDLDYNAYVEGLRRFNPKIVAFSPWMTSVGGKRGENIHAIVSNINADALMHDPWIVTRDDTPFVQKDPAPELPVPRDESDGTSPSQAGRYAWDFDGTSTEEWSRGTSILKMYAAGHRLNVFYHGPSPSISSPEALGMRAAAYPRMRIRVRNHSTSKRMILQWATKPDRKWNTLKQKEFAVERNGLSYTECDVDLFHHGKWEGVVEQVRLFPAPDSVTGSAEIDYIVFDQAGRNQHRQPSSAKSP